MTLDAFPFLQRREIEKLLFRFKTSRRHGFFLCTGGDLSFSERVASEMRDQLGPDEVISVSLAPDELDPWNKILSSRSTRRQVVVAHLAEATEPAVLRKLDVQRELLHQERVILVLWITSNALSSFADLAPNLWSIRRDTSYFSILADIVILAAVDISKTAQRPSIQQILSELEHDLRSYKPSDPILYLNILLKKSSLLTRVGQFRDSHLILNNLQKFASSDRVFRWRFHNQMLQNILSQDQFDVASAYIKNIKFEFTPYSQLDHLICLIIKVNMRSHRFREADSFFEQLIDKFSSSSYDKEQSAASKMELVMDKISFLNLLGSFKVLQATKKVIPYFLSNELPKYLDLMSIHENQVSASIAWENLRCIEALEHTTKSLLIAQRIGAQDAEYHLLCDIARKYAALGFREEAAQARTDAEKIKQIFPNLEERPLLQEHPSLDAPFDRLSRAVEGAEWALTRSESSKAEEQLQRCERAWSDEDPRFRSRYLLARWKKAEARLLVLQGEGQRAVSLLRETMNQLDELPRTRLDLLLAIAQLGSEIDASVREEAAEEALNIALSSDVLDVERDARRLLAPLVRAREENELAVFHEEEARRIDGALALLPPAADSP